MTAHASLIDRIKSESVPDVATRLEIPVGRRGRSLKGCPACGAERRSSSDKRGPIGFRGGGWRCFACGAKGSPLDLLTLGLFGTRWGRLNDGQKRTLYTMYAVPLPKFLRPKRRLPRRPDRRTYPPAGEVRELLEASLYVTEDEQVADWCRRRGLKPTRIDDLHAAVVLPDSPLPRWARRGRQDWNQTGHRLAVPLFDPTGTVRSVTARAVVPAERKGLFPAGHSVSGLAMADAGAQAGLRGSTSFRNGIVVAEGVPDFLTWATAWSDADEAARCVLGLFSGSWTRALADRIPSRATIISAVHHDETGDRFHHRIQASLRGRCHLRRLEVAA